MRRRAQPHPTTTTATAQVTRSTTTSASGYVEHHQRSPDDRRRDDHVYDNRLAWVGIAWEADCPIVEAENSTLHCDRVQAMSGCRPRRPDRAQRPRLHRTAARRACEWCSPASERQPPRGDRLGAVAACRGRPAPRCAATIPACGTYFGWTDLTTQNASSALEVLARAPFDPRCTPEADSPLVVDSVVPLGPAQAQVPHAPLGPVDGLLHPSPGG